MKTLFTNCKIYDGSEKENALRSILIEDDKIIDIGDFSGDNMDATIVDLQGLSIAPGFIDAHSHNDWFSIQHDNEKYFEPFLRQGISSFITGNCGLSVAGYRKDTQYAGKLGGSLFNTGSVKEDFSNFDTFFDTVNKRSPLNIASLVGHCTTRTGISGFENRLLTSEEEKEMHATFEQSLESGACGISLGLMYEPGIYAKKEELRKIVDICAKYNKPLTVHPRACSGVSMAYAIPFGRSHILRALDELVDITKGKNVKLQYSHAIFVGKKSFGAHKPLIQTLHNIRKNGVDAMFDLYAQECGVTVITIIMPVWFQAMSVEDKKKKSNIAKFKTMAVVSKNLLGFDFGDMYIAYMGDEYTHFEGKSVAEIAKELRMSELDTYLFLCEASDYKGRVIVYNYSSPEIISILSKSSISLYQTDAWVEEKGVQNPSMYDCFPKFLHLSLNGTGDTMINSVRKMTGAVADRFSLQKRGYIKKGYFADLTVFDEDELKSTKPNQEKSFGIKTVYVNGKLVLENGIVHYHNFKNAGVALKT